jgi:hypothetical protein
MRCIRYGAVLLIAINSAFAGEIREFSISTLERLGNDLYQADQLSARAISMVEKQYPAFKKNEAGWVTQLRPESSVHLIMKSGSAFTEGYVVVFPKSGPPLIHDRRGQQMSEDIAVRYRARQTGIDAATKQRFDMPYNYELLNDPNGSGFLLYAIATSRDPDDQVITGHIRVIVSADGKRAERVDRLSHGVMILNPRKDRVPGYHQAEAVTTQVVSNKPVETFVYANHLYGLPIMVVTPDAICWEVANGKIKNTGKRADQQKP